MQISQEETEMVSVRELVDIWCGKCRNSSFCTGTQKPIILTHSSWRIAFISVSWLNFVNLQASKFHRSDKSRTSVAVSAGISVNWLFLQPGQPSNNVTKKLPQVDKEKFIWWEQGCSKTIYILNTGAGLDKMDDAGHESHKTEVDISAQQTLSIFQ